jgi:hypothetical protein
VSVAGPEKTELAVERAGDWDDWCEKRHFLRHLCIKCIFLPRQARDKRMKSQGKE